MLLWVPHTLRGNENGGPQGGCQAQGTGFLLWIYHGRDLVAWACSLGPSWRDAGDACSRRRIDGDSPRFFRWAQPWSKNR